MENGHWLGYNELAWIEPIVAPPEEYAQETERYCDLIKAHSKIEPRTLLHLGSGAGINDYTFKKHFKVTGVDISRGMLDVAGKLNPEVVYHYGDMRDISLGKSFDAVIIPESIGYMTTVVDARKAIITANNHLKTGGVLLFVTHIREEFWENNFVYEGSKEDIDITVFENNYIPDQKGNTYEATVIYLIRRKGELEIHTDRHLIGLFDLEMWLEILEELKFEVIQERLEGSYDSFILGEGEYPLRLFICHKT